MSATADDQPALTRLNDATVRKLATEQIVTDPVAAVKELIENSLDARASDVAVVVQTSVFHQLSVKDNGQGMPAEHRRSCCLPYSTTKIRRYEDIGRVTSYGFRGEGLHALCQEASVQIASQTVGELRGELVSYGEDGAPLDIVEHSQQGSSSSSSGTTVIVRELFARKPVRLEYLKNQAEKHNAWHKLRELVASYALMHWSVRFSLSYPGRPLFTFKACASLRDAFRALFGASTAAELVDVVPLSSAHIQFHGLLPDPRAQHVDRVMLPGSAQRSRAIAHLYLNARPIAAPFALKLIRAATRRAFARQGHAKSFPVVLLNILMPSDGYDVNVTPDKKKVIFSNESDLARALESMLLRLYPLSSDDTDNRAATVLSDDDTDDIASKQASPIDALPPVARPVSIVDKSVSSTAAISQSSISQSSISQSSISQSSISQLSSSASTSSASTSISQSSISQSSSSASTSIKQSSSASASIKQSLSSMVSMSASGGVVVLDDDDSVGEKLPVQSPPAEKKRRVVVSSDPLKRNRSAKPPAPGISVAEMERFYERRVSYQPPPPSVRFVVVSPVTSQPSQQVLLVSDLVADKLLFVHSQRLAEALPQHAAGLSLLQQLDLLFQMRDADRPLNCPHGRPIFAELPADPTFISPS